MLLHESSGAYLHHCALLFRALLPRRMQSSSSSSHPLTAPVQMASPFKDGILSDWEVADGILDHALKCEAAWAAHGHVAVFAWGCRTDALSLCSRLACEPLRTALLCNAVLKPDAAAASHAAGCAAGSRCGLPQTATQSC